MTRPPDTTLFGSLVDDNDFVAGGDINMIVMINGIKNFMNCGQMRDNKAALQQYLKINLHKFLEDGTTKEEITQSRPPDTTLF